MAIITVEQIADVLGRHRVKYDSFDQNVDSWYCDCNGIRQYHGRSDAEQHVAQQIHIKVLGEIAGEV